MRIRTSLVAVAMGICTLAAEPAQAQDPGAVEEIVVWGDLFARWDDTRWMIQTEVAMPYWVWLAKDENLSFKSDAFQIRTILACSKEWKLGRHRYEVDCQLEDFGIQSAVDEAKNLKEADVERAQKVLDEIDAKLTGAKLQLQVVDDGRVVGVDLEGVPKNNRRQSVIHETLRQVMSRVILGFDMKLRKFNQLHEGKWVEYNPALMSMPPPMVEPSGGGVPKQVGGASQGSSMMVHYLNKYKGHVLVQSIGRGLIVWDSVNYNTDYIGVSIYDPDGGYMTERVWALDGMSTASSFFSTGNYWHAGRIQILGEDDRPDVGPTQVISTRGSSAPGLPPWVPIER